MWRTTTTNKQPTNNKPTNNQQQTRINNNKEPTTTSLSLHITSHHKHQYLPVKLFVSLHYSHSISHWQDTAETGKSWAGSYGTHTCKRQHPRAADPGQHPATAHHGSAAIRTHIRMTESRIHSLAALPLPDAVGAVTHATRTINSLQWISRWFMQTAFMDSPTNHTETAARANFLWQVRSQRTSASEIRVVRGGWGFTDFTTREPDVRHVLHLLVPSLLPYIYPLNCLPKCQIPWFMRSKILQLDCRLRPIKSVHLPYSSTTISCTYPCNLVHSFTCSFICLNCYDISP